MALSKISLSTSDKISFISNLSTMLSAGIPILEAVNSLLEDTKGNQRKILETLRDDLTQGKHIHQSLAQFPQAFDAVTVNLIKAAEETGTLETILKDLRAHIQREVEFIDRVKFALIYPIFILIVFVLVLFGILIFVVPRITTVFLRLKVPLPLPTKVLIFASDLLLKQTWYVVGVAALLLTIGFIVYKQFKQQIAEVFFALPLVSGLIKEIDLTRFSRSMYLLLTSGLPIATALELCQEIVFKKSMKDIIAKSRQMVLAGQRLTEGFRTAHKELPSIVVKLIEAGEKSGTLDKSMQDISEYLDYQVTNTLKALTAIMEPLMMVVVGVCVGAMMVAIIAPIYGMIGQVGHR